MKKLYKTRRNTEIVVKGRYGTETLICKGRYSDVFYGEKLENVEHVMTDMICIPDKIYSDIDYTRSGLQMYLPYNTKNGDSRYKKVKEKDFILCKSRLEYYEVSLSNVSMDKLKWSLSAKEFIEFINDNCVGKANLFL